MENELENRDLMKAVWISIPVILAALWLLWRTLFAGKSWGVIIGNAVAFLFGALFLVGLLYRLIHWYMSQERGWKSLVEMHPWKCIRCGTVVMGTIHAPEGGSACPKCGGVLVLARFS